MSLLWLMECKGCISRNNKNSYTSLHTNSIYKQNSSTSSLSSVESDLRSCMSTPLPSMSMTSSTTSVGESLPTSSTTKLQCDIETKPAVFAPTLAARSPQSPTISGCTEEVDDGFILL